MIGDPGSHALPISITIEPSGAKRSESLGARSRSHLRYCSPIRLPYFFGRTNGNGGDVKIRSTVPFKFVSSGDSSAFSIELTYMVPSSVSYAFERLSILEFDGWAGVLIGLPLESRCVRVLEVR